LSNVVVVVVVVGVVSRRPLPWHCWWHGFTVCWRVARWQKRSTVTCTLRYLSISYFSASL